MYDRYSDISKSVTNADDLEITDDFCVYISAKEDYDIIVDLEDSPDDYEKLKPFIILLAERVNELDNTVQRFHNSKRRRNKLVALPSPFGIKI